MKRFLYNIWVLSIVGLLVSCTGDDTLWKDAGGASIKLQFSDGLLLSRAADDTEAERAIKHLDVFIFDVNHQNLIYERINNPATSGEDREGTVTLKASLSDFADRSENYVYVIANATATFAGTESWDNLKSKIQTDLNIHMTGTGLPDMPTHFLMDGIAKNANASTNTSVTIDANANDDVTLEVILERAAAKVEVTLNQGTDYKFLQDVSNDNRGYYFRNMPYKTTLLDMQDTQGNQIYPTDYLRTPNKANDKQSFNWGIDKVVITGYVYSHKWFSGSLESTTGHYYQTGTSLIVNIPLWRDVDNNSKFNEGDDVYLNSYYQIPIVKEETTNTWQIKRNTLYKVEATIEAPGAEDNKEPQTLQNLKYQIEEWVQKEITVGNQVQPKYLEVNKNLLEMHNVATDATLEFTSSSTIKSVTISDAYYYNKYGNKISISNTNYNSNGMSTSFDNTVLKGVITINSNVPTNFTARYFTLTVTNEDGAEETVEVVQYPVICVSNQLSRYSYRDDFTNTSGTVMTFEKRYNNGKVNVSAEVNNGKWTGELNYGTGSSGGFFASKVRGPSDDDNDGNYPIYTYTGSSEYARVFQDDGNARMYRIDVKATSSEYVVGKPRLTNEVTDPSWDNQRMVSPSFMIASRLAVISSDAGNLDDLNDGEKSGLNHCGIKFDKETSSVIVGDVTYYNSSNHSFKQDDDAYVKDNDELLKVYTDHCKKYVEVLTDGTVFDDWRLPTAAEIQFIIDTQGTGTNSEAIDYLLNGLFYYSACGPVYNNKPNSSGKTIRCVRDVN